MALTAATFALGASALAARDRTTVGGISLGAVVLLAGVLLWHAFYFADRYWYHPLLIASVRHGEQLETELRTMLPQVGLTLDITEGSPSKPPVLWFWRREKLRSSDKLLYFYVIGGVVLVLAALLLQIASWISPALPTTGGAPQSDCCGSVPSRDAAPSEAPPRSQAPHENPATTGLPGSTTAVQPALPPEPSPPPPQQAP